MTSVSMGANAARQLLRCAKVTEARKKLLSAFVSRKTRMAADDDLREVAFRGCRRALI